MLKKKVNSSESNQTLEKYVRKLIPEAPLSFIYKLFRKKDVKVNGHWQDKKYVISTNEEISIYITDQQLDDFKNKTIYNSSNELEDLIVYEDNNVLIANKPRGLLVQKDSKNTKSLTDMVISYLIYKKEYDPSIESAFVPAPAHRLDRNTSGLVVYGKSLEALQYLFTLFKEKEDISKHYIALVKGDLDDGEITAPLLKDNESNLVKVSPYGKKAITKYHVIKKFDGYSLVEVIILTGRTHQIRVHMAYISHPVIGDNKYGDFELNKEFEKKYHFTNQFLHASRLDFGKLNKPLDKLSSSHFEASLPKSMEDIINSLSLNKH